ncbi:hypothetical protein D3C84_1226440 [compost metagenome]
MGDGKVNLTLQLAEFVDSGLKVVGGVETIVKLGQADALRDHHRTPGFIKTGPQSFEYFVVYVGA